MKRLTDYFNPFTFIIWGAIFGLLYWGFHDDIKINKLKVHKTQQIDLAAKARFEKGAYIESAYKLNEQEGVDILVIPQRFGNDYSDIYDKRCAVYINAAVKTSSMSCESDGQETSVPDQ